MVGALIQYDRCPCTKRERDMERHTGRRHLVKTEVGIGAMALKPTDPKDPGREVWKDSPSQPQREAEGPLCQGPARATPRPWPCQQCPSVGHDGSGRPEILGWG